MSLAPYSPALTTRQFAGNRLLSGTPGQPRPAAAAFRVQDLLKLKTKTGVSCLPCDLHCCINALTLGGTTALVTMCGRYQLRLYRKRKTRTTKAESSSYKIRWH